MLAMIVITARTHVVRTCVLCQATIATVLRLFDRFESVQTLAYVSRLRQKEYVFYIRITEMAIRLNSRCRSHLVVVSSGYSARPRVQYADAKGKPRHTAYSSKLTA